jgi:AcrR family transcriptional regulator
VDAETARQRLLDHADRLFYGEGLQTVSVHDVRAASGVSLKRLYQCYPSKEALISAYLARRDQRWRAELREFVTTAGETPTERILLVFDSLEAWFRQPDFRGCAFINAFGELGRASPVIAEAARHHKAALFAFLLELAADTAADDPEALARQLVILVDGAIVSASFTGDPEAARWARDAAAALLAAAA